MMFYKETEFQETPLGSIPKDWDILKLEDNKVSTLVKSGSTPLKNRVDYWNGTIPFVTIGDMTKTEKYLYDTDKKITDSAIKNSNTILVPENCILLSMYGTIGKVVINKVPMTISQNIAAIVPNRENIYEEFLHYALKHYSFQFKGAKIITLKHLDMSIVKNSKIPLPPLSEQKRIAEVLGVVDSAIELVDKIIWKTERLKKALMQTLLTRGIGHKEFKETEIGKIPKTWEVVKIEDVFRIETGTTPSTKVKEYWESGSIKWLTPIDLSKLNGKLHISDSERKITESALKDYNLTLMPKGSIILSTRAPVGYVAVIDDEMTFNQGCKGLIPKPNVQMDVEYYAYYLISIKKELEQFSGGSTFKELSKQTLENLRVPFPSFLEQHQIAKILSTVDKKLEVERNEKVRLERIKQGLMDLLLTGKVRVKVD
ncbi:MAG: restriction endonuclease subunit S [Candidatus Bathyarchaeia archaeon]